MMKVPFQCISTKPGCVVLAPIGSQDPNSEVRKFYQEHPAGGIELRALQAAVENQFEAGKTYLVEITDPSKPEASKHEEAKG